VHIKNKRGHYFVWVTEALCPINSKKKLHQYWMTNKNPIYLPSMQNFRIWTHFWREKKIMAHQKPVMMIILQKNCINIVRKKLIPLLGPFYVKNGNNNIMKTMHYSIHILDDVWLIYHFNWYVCKLHIDSLINYISMTIKFPT
jgi:hypothetical protein